MTTPVQPETAKPDVAVRNQGNKGGNAVVDRTLMIVLLVVGTAMAGIAAGILAVCYQKYRRYESLNPRPRV